MGLKASVFVGVSLDGFIARRDGTFDFLSPSGDVPHGWDEFMATVDALVMGRNTFDVVAAFDSWPYGAMPVFVLSTRPLPSLPAGVVVEQMAGSPDAIVEQIAARGIKHTYVDGGITIQRFLDAGRIDRLIVTRVPVLIGTGIPLFGPLGRDVHLKLVGSRQFSTGLVQSEYEVISPRAG